MATKVEKWEAEDGKLFDSEALAKDWDVKRNISLFIRKHCPKESQDAVVAFVIDNVYPLRAIICMEETNEFPKQRQSIR